MQARPAGATLSPLACGLLGLLACGGTASGPVGALSAQKVSTPAGPEKSPRQASEFGCPEQAELEAVARAAWQVEGGALTLSCAAGNFGEPAWAIWGLAYDVPSTESDDDDEEDAAAGFEGASGQRHLALVTAGGQVIAHAAEYELRWLDLDYGPTPSYRPHDLDGDGVDELLTLVQDTRDGLIVTTVTVTRLVGGELLRYPGEILVSFDDSAAVDEAPGPTSCAGKVQVLATERGQEIVIRHETPTGDPSVWAERCAPAGVQHMIMRGGALVPAPSSERRAP